MEKLIRLLDSNAKLSNEELAAMLGKTELEVAQDMDRLERDGILRGYRAIINWDNVGEVPYVTAFIEVKVQPKLGIGFDEVANRMSALPEVESVYLMSGGFDLGIMMNGKSFQEIALFVARRLSALDGVTSTATHFVLKKYKESGIKMENKDKDDRRHISL